MCGIVGYWDKTGADGSVSGRMAMCIQHRGPEDDDVYLNEEGDLALARRRLSIIDLTPAGHQPMISPCGWFTLIITVRSTLETSRGRICLESADGAQISGRAGKVAVAPGLVSICATLPDGASKDGLRRAY